MVKRRSGAATARLRGKRALDRVLSRRRRASAAALAAEKRQRQRRVAGVLVAVALSFGAGIFLNGGNGVRQAFAAMAVFDSSNLAKNAETAAQTAKILAKATDQLTRLDSMLKSLGLGGFDGAVSTGTKLFSATRSGSTVLGSAKVLGDLNLGDAVLEGVMGRAQGALPSGVSDSLPQIRSIIRETLSRVSVQGAQQQHALEVNRDQAVLSASETALAEALHGSASTADTAQAVDTLAAEAKAAAETDGSMRQQMAVLTSAVLRLTEEVAANRRVNAAGVAIDAAKNLARPASTFMPARAKMGVLPPPPAANGAGSGVFDQ